MKARSYIQHSRKIAQSFDADILGALKIGKPIGYGSTATVFALGNVLVDSAEMPLCLKLSKQSSTTDLRIIRELSTTETITSRAPDLWRLFPHFMTVLAIDESTNTVGILTEDVTHNQEFWAYPISARQETRDVLCAALGRSDDLNAGTVEDSVAFEVNGEERWLDLTPSPLKPTDEIYKDQRRSRLYVERHLPELTCTIAGSSALVASLEGWLPRPS